MQIPMVVFFTNITKNRLLITILPLFLLVFTPNVFAQEAPVCVTEWCDASWPPVEGEDRTIGKDNCGNVCIKILKTVEVEKIVEVEKETRENKISVTLSKDENGEPVMTASCPATGFNQYDLEALKLGYEYNISTRGGEVTRYWK